MIKKDLIQDFFLKERKAEGIERDLKVPTDIDKVISIVGPRRAGKSWYLYLLSNKLKNTMYASFDDIAFRGIEKEEFFDVIKIHSELKYAPSVIMLDEVQAIEGWQILVRSLLDRGYRIFITGSSSKVLPKEISTELRGRTLTYLLLPFSFKEFNKKEKLTELHTYEGKGQMLKALKEYLTWGGYPEVVLCKDEKNKEKILSEYFNEIFYKDFVERHKIKSLEFGRFLFEFSFQNFSKETSLKKIKSFFGKNISDKTLYEYVEKLQDTLTVFFVGRYSKSVYERQSWPKKIYVCDVGISKVLGFSEDIGKRMENCVYLELLRRKNEKPLTEIYYWKDQFGKEVDFVVKNGIKIEQLIQVCYETTEEVIDREIKSLLKASKELACKNLTILTWDYEGEKIHEGRKIKLIPLWKWLLS